MPRGKPKHPKVSPLTRAELYELAAGMPYRGEHSKAEIHKWLQEYNAEELRAAEEKRLAELRETQYSGVMATSTKPYRVAAERTTTFGIPTITFQIRNTENDEEEILGGHLDIEIARRLRDQLTEALEYHDSITKGQS